MLRPPEDEHATDQTDRCPDNELTEELTEELTDGVTHTLILGSSQSWLYPPPSPPLCSPIRLERASLASTNGHGGADVETPVAGRREVLIRVIAASASSATGT